MKNKKVLFIFIVSFIILYKSSFAINVQFPYLTDAQTLDSFDSSYFLDISNQNAGNLSSVRVSGAYTGITGLGRLTSLNVSGNMNVTGNIFFAKKSASATPFLAQDSTGTMWIGQNGTYNGTSVVSQATAGSSAMFFSGAGNISILNSSSLSAGSALTTMTTRMRITNAGLVGINTTAPQRQFSVVGDIQCTGNIYESNFAYAELYVSYNATVTAITSAGVYATVTANVTQDDLKNFTFTSTATDKYLTCGVAGTYQFCLYMSFSGGNSDEFHGGVSINNNPPSGKHEFSRKMGAGGDVGSAGTGGIITLAVNDTLRIKIANETDADDPTIKNLNFSIRRIAP